MYMLNLFLYFGNNFFCHIAFSEFFNFFCLQLWDDIGGFLLGRTLAVLTTMTLGTSMAARQGPLAMAAHQICIQVWLAVSLLTDALATSGQVLASHSSSLLVPIC